MEQGIPEQIKLFKFAAKGLIFSQTYQVRDFPRISALVNNINEIGNNALVKVELNFSLENNRIPCIRGKIELDLALTCQRCLNEISIHLQPSFQLAYLQNEQQGEALNPSFETVLNADKEFSTIEFITDEVLISIPMIPMHNHGCSSYKDTQTTEVKKRENPFAILKQLKDKNN